MEITLKFNNQGFEKVTAIFSKEKKVLAQEMIKNLIPSYHIDAKMELAVDNGKVFVNITPEKRVPFYHIVEFFTQRIAISTPKLLAEPYWMQDR